MLAEAVALDAEFDALVALAAALVADVDALDA